MPIKHRDIWLAGAAGCTALLAAAQSARADGPFYCETHVVDVGATSQDVRTRCGDPDNTQARTEQRIVGRRVTVPCQTGYCTSYIEDAVSIQIEEWTYDFGRNRLVKYLTFEAGQLVQIRSGKYGTKAPQ